MTHERAPRWRVGVVAATALVALGLLYASPLLLASAVVPLGYVAYGALSTVPSGATLRVERAFDDRAPAPGETVTVTLTVENTSEATLVDLRVIDGVPADLAVVEGSARTATALRPGETATLSYGVVARRGEFDFTDPLVRLRSLAGARVVTESVTAAGETRLSAADPVAEAPAAAPALTQAGTQPTDRGGEGLAFRSTREYRPGDPMNRVNWRRFARTRELTTVSFREERSVRAVVVVDARRPGRVRPRPGVPTAADLCGYAAHRLYEALVAADATASVAAVGVDAGPAVPSTPDGIPWVEGADGDSVERARTVFSAVQAADDDRDGVPGSLRLGANAPADGRPAARRSDSGHAEATPGANGGTAAAANDGATGEGDAGGRRSEAPAPDGGSGRVRRLLARFPPTARVVFVTPLVDEWPLSFVEQVRGRDHPVTVVSPDATGAGSLGATVVGLERRRRLRDLAAGGATVVDWDREEPIDVALADSLGSILEGGG